MLCQPVRSWQDVQLEASSSVAVPEWGSSWQSVHREKARRKRRVGTSGSSGSSVPVGSRASASSPEGTAGWQLSQAVSR